MSWCTLDKATLTLDLRMVHKTVARELFGGGHARIWSLNLEALEFKSCYYSTLRLSGAFQYKNIGEYVDTHNIFEESCVCTGFILMGFPPSKRF